MKVSLRSLILIWLGWFVVLYGFQWVVTTRLQLKRPDLAVSWTKTETLQNSNDGKIYLLDPFMNRQVAWDSEYYVGIAVGGYDDPNAGTAQNPKTYQMVIKNYSFFPLYPFIMHIFMIPLKALGLTPIGTAVLAGIIVTLLGTLAGMIALWELTFNLFDEESAWRSVFYMLIFPSAFFFAQVYTEGLFVGLAFWSLVMIKRKQWLWASLLGLFAAWTRAHGAVLVLPLLIAWITNINWNSNIRPQISWKWVAQGLCAFLPLIAYIIWRISPLGAGWAELQVFLFGRGLLSIGRSIGSWSSGIEYALGNGKDGLIYMLLEIGSIVLALSSSIWLLRKDFITGSFSTMVVLLSVFSGSAQSMARYMLIAPALYIGLARAGRNQVIDKVWTIASLLLMGMSVMLFCYDMWVG